MTTDLLVEPIFAYGNENRGVYSPALRCPYDPEALEEREPWCIMLTSAVGEKRIILSSMSEKGDALSARLRPKCSELAVGARNGSLVMLRALAKLPLSPLLPDNDKAPLPPGFDISWFCPERAFAIRWLKMA